MSSAVADRVPHRPRVPDGQNEATTCGRFDFAISRASRAALRGNWIFLPAIILETKYRPDVKRPSGTIARCPWRIIVDPGLTCSQAPSQEKTIIALRSA